jgi:hydroxymethylbilane synthase
LAYRPDLNIISLRGNVDTRLKKVLDPAGPYDAVVLAVAGLKRIGLARHISQRLPFDCMLPAPGQGAIAVQCRAGDESTLARLAQINHLPTQQAVLAERAFLAALGGGCSVPVGALGQVEDEFLSLQGVVADPNGHRLIRIAHHGPPTAAQLLGQTLARQALAQGAREILEGIRV